MNDWRYYPHEEKKLCNHVANTLSDIERNRCNACGKPLVDENKKLCFDVGPKTLELCYTGLANR